VERILIAIEFVPSGFILASAFSSIHKHTQPDRTIHNQNTYLSYYARIQLARIPDLKNGQHYVTTCQVSLPIPGVLSLRPILIPLADMFASLQKI
jgi:hypothetical protein